MLESTSEVGLDESDTSSAQTITVVTVRFYARTTSTQSIHDPSDGFIRALWMYLDIIGELRGHQVVELLLTQGARGLILPGVRLELGDKGADGSLHDGVCALRP